MQLLGVAFWRGSQGFRGWRLAQAASQGCTPALGSVQDSRAIWGKSPRFYLTSPFGKGTACPQRAAPVSPGALKGPLRKPWEIKPFLSPVFSLHVFPQRRRCWKCQKPPCRASRALELSKPARAAAAFHHFAPRGRCRGKAGRGRAPQGMEQSTPGDKAGHPRGHLQPEAGCAGRRPRGNKGPVLPKGQASCTQQGRTQPQQPRTHPAPHPRPQQPWGCPCRPPPHPAIEPADGPPSPRHRARLNWLILFPSWQGNWGSVVSPAGSGRGLSLAAEAPRCRVFPLLLPGSSVPAPFCTSRAFCEGCRGRRKTNN